MAARVVAVDRGDRRRSRGEADAGGALPPWARWTLAVGLAALFVVGLGVYFYRALDAMYPQELWKYFRPAAPVGAGSVVYRDADGGLFLAPVGEPRQANRLFDASLAPGTRELVRDAVALPDGKHVAYFATERGERRPESDHVKVVTLDGTLVRGLAVGEAAGEPMRPALYGSTSGRYLAVTSRDRARVYYYDVAAGGALIAGTADAAPERMLWNRNADLRTPLLPNQPAFAASPDGKLRAQVRAGSRRAPDCLDEKCEVVQELTISPTAAAGAGRPPTVLYGAFSAFSAEGWGPIPPQPAHRLYGRLVWSPDGRQLLFNTLDGAEMRTYSIGTDGKTRPRLVLESGEALDWMP